MSGSIGHLRCLHPIYVNPDIRDAHGEQLVLRGQATMHSTSRQAKRCISSFFVCYSFSLSDDVNKQMRTSRFTIKQDTIGSNDGKANSRRGSECHHPMIGRIVVRMLRNTMQPPQEEWNKKRESKHNSRTVRCQM